MGAWTPHQVLGRLLPRASFKVEVNMKHCLFNKIVFIAFLELFLMLGACLTATAQSDKMLAHRGNKMFANGDFTEAELNYKRSLRAEEETDLDAAIYNLGNALYAQKRYDEAVEQFNGVVSKVRDKGMRNKAYFNLGNVYLEQQKFEEAIEMYKEALRLNPADDEARYNLTYAKQQLKNESEQEKQERQQENQCDNPKENKDQENQEQQEKEKQENQEEQEQQEQQENQDQQNQEQQEQQENQQSEEEKQQKEQEEKEGESEEEKQSKEGEESEPQDSLDQQPQGSPQDSLQGQPQTAELSQEQIMQLLEALKNEELKVQQKLRSKGKGRSLKTDKDW